MLQTIKQLIATEIMKRFEMKANLNANLTSKTKQKKMTRSSVSALKKDEWFQSKKKDNSLLWLSSAESVSFRRKWMYDCQNYLENCTNEIYCFRSLSVVTQFYDAFFSKVKIHFLHFLWDLKVNEVMISKKFLATLSSKDPLYHNNTYDAVMNEKECSWICLFRYFLFLDSEVRSKKGKMKNRAHMAGIVVIETNTDFFLLFSSRFHLKETCEIMSIYGLWKL